LECGASTLTAFGAAPAGARADGHPEESRMLTQSGWEPIVRLVLEETKKAIDRLVENFAPKLQAWLDDILNNPISADWRDELAAFVQRTADDDNLAIAPHSVAALERLIESRAPETRGAKAKRQVASFGTPANIGAPAGAAEAFDDGSPQPIQPKPRFILVADKPGGSRTYRKAFKDATPALPAGYEVHHIFEKGREILAERFRKELSVDLNDLDNLRGVPDKVHDEISAIQTKFWAAKAKEHGGDYKAAYANVPLAEVRKLQAEIEATYKSFWVKSGATAQEIAAVEKRLKSPRVMNLRPARIEGTLKNAGLAVTGFAIFTLIYDNIVLANNIANPPPHVQTALDNMLKWYAAVYEIRVTRGFIKKEEWGALQDATMKYLNAAGFDNSVKALFLREFEVQGANLSGS
jgi:hypothetical protein